MTGESFDRLVADWLLTHRSANTRAAYRADLDSFQVWWREHRRRAPLTAMATDVEQFAAVCVAAGASDATVARRLSALSSFFTFAMASRAVTRSPVRASHRPSADNSTQTVDLDDRQVAALIRSSGRLGHRASVLVGLLLFDGLKLAEVLAADADDVNITFQGGNITVRRRGDLVVIPLDPRTTAALRSYIERRTAGPLLLGESPTRAPARLTRFGADFILKQVSAEAGLTPAISANVLRRSYVASAYASGASIESIRGRLGHADVRTTRRHLTRRG